MSQENVEVVRGTRIALHPLSERAARRRTLDERFFVRFPALYRRQAAAFWRATGRSRLRRRLAAYSIQRGYAALNRRDYEVALMRSDPDVEYRPSGDLMPPDLEPVFYGHDGYRKLWSRWFDAFEDLRWTPRRSSTLETGFSSRLGKGARIGQRRGHERAGVPALQDPTGPVDLAGGLHGPRPSPRSRRAAGVGDVAGERGDQWARGLP